MGKGPVPEPDICFCLISQGMGGSLCHTRVDGSARQYISRNLKSDVSISINTVNMVSCSLATSWFPGGSEVKNLPGSAGDACSISGSGRPPGRGHGNPLQYSCLEDSMDGGAWESVQSMGSQSLKQ